MGERKAHACRLEAGGTGTGKCQRGSRYPRFLAVCGLGLGSPPTVLVHNPIPRRPFVSV